MQLRQARVRYATVLGELLSSHDYSENFAADFSSSLVFCKYGKKRTKLLDRYYGPGVNTCRSRHAYGAL